MTSSVQSEYWTLPKSTSAYNRAHQRVEPIDANKRYGHVQKPRHYAETQYPQRQNGDYRDQQYNSILSSEKSGAFGQKSRLMSPYINNKEFDKCDQQLDFLPKIIPDTGSCQNMTYEELCTFRTQVCPKKAADDNCFLKDSCSYSHCLSWHRRNPKIVDYRPTLCPNVVFWIGPMKNMRVSSHCPRGRLCSYSHTKEEQMYHPLVYKTQICRDWPNCYKYYCPFAHGAAEQRLHQGTELPSKAFQQNDGRYRHSEKNNKIKYVEKTQDYTRPAYKTLPSQPALKHQVKNFSTTTEQGPDSDLSLFSTKSQISYYKRDDDFKESTACCDDRQCHFLRQQRGIDTSKYASRNNNSVSSIKLNQNMQNLNSTTQSILQEIHFKKIDNFDKRFNGQIQYDNKPWIQNGFSSPVKQLKERQMWVHYNSHIRPDNSSSQHFSSDNNVELDIYQHMDYRNTRPAESMLDYFEQEKNISVGCTQNRYSQQQDVMKHEQSRAMSKAYPATSQAGLASTVLVRSSVPDKENVYDFCVPTVDYQGAHGKPQRNLPHSDCHLPPSKARDALYDFTQNSYISQCDLQKSRNSSERQLWLNNSSICDQTELLDEDDICSELSPSITVRNQYDDAYQSVAGYSSVNNKDDHLLFSTETKFMDEPQVTDSTKTAPSTFSFSHSTRNRGKTNENYFVLLGLPPTHSTHNYSDLSGATSQLSRPMHHTPVSQSLILSKNDEEQSGLFDTDILASSDETVFSGSQSNFHYIDRNLAEDTASLSENYLRFSSGEINCYDKNKATNLPDVISGDKCSQHTKIQTQASYNVSNRSEPRFDCNGKMQHGASSSLQMFSQGDICIAFSP